MVKSIPAVFTVIIHPNEGRGYWAECIMPNGGCNTDGDTIQDVERNMFESVALFLQDDYPDITDFSLTFEVLDA
jgi:predicted RNase H-like HicB family nuclease